MTLRSLPQEKALARSLENRSHLEERSKILRKIGDLILERQEELARLECLDTGKPFSLANSVDIPRAAYNFHFFADYVISLGTDAYQQNQTGS